MTTTVVAALAALAVASAAAGAATPKPNDPGWPGQWGLRSTGISGLWPQVAPGVHPVIATIDTGVDPTFPDLRGAIVPGWDVLEGDATPRSTNDHGTQIATVIAARTNNGIGLSGACPVCLLMPIRVSTDGHAAPATIATGIRTAVQLGARILVVSLAAGGSPDTGEQDAVSYAVSRGAVVIAAAGNAGGTAPEYPGALDGVVAVAGTDPGRKLYPWSTSGQWVELAAPGCVYQNAMCGSSFAPPLVAAAVGLLVAAHPQRSPADAVQALRATARPVAGIGGGTIDALAASVWLGPTAVPQPEGTTTPDVLVLQGTFRNTLTRKLRLGAGTLLLRLRGGDVRGCTLSLRSSDVQYVAADPDRLGLRIAATVRPGSFSVGVRCDPAKARAYTLSVAGVTADVR